jgi:4-hydroxymandelate oxidase
MSAALITLDDYEAAARDCVSPAAWEYIHSGAADELTLRWNRDAFNTIKLNPRVMVDVSGLDTRIRLLGQELAHPILLAPVASHTLAHAEGEVATARGAKAAAAGMVLSSYTTVPVEAVAGVGPSPLWFQLYMQRREVTRELIPLVCSAGCSAICVTVDTPVLGARDRLSRSSFAFPPNLPYRTVAPGENPCTWADIAWIREVSTVPVLLKGILNPDDAHRGIEAGAAGIIVSNHGGRNLDTVPATIEALPRVVERVGGRVPVIVDGGIRRGTDVLKALALGADAVMIGRPYIYGLAVAGADGVAAVVNILRRELEMAMALTGKTTIASIDRSVIWS